MQTVPPLANALLCYMHILLSYYTVVCYLKQYRRGWDYPLHLGVTEAGEGEDGRMKSAIGIGALLQV
jgi:4-hydroxy-3-methylbut-2-en-1-yl diphosphate synthase IspG/GcpE